MKSLIFGVAVLLLVGCDRRRYNYITTGETEVIISTVPVNVPIEAPKCECCKKHKKCKCK